MKKYTLNIFPTNENNETKFIGQALIGEEVVFTTKSCSEPSLASRELQKFLTSQQQPATLNINEYKGFNSISYSASSHTQKIISRGSCCK